MKLIKININETNFKQQELITDSEMILKTELLPGELWNEDQPAPRKNSENKAQWYGAKFLNLQLRSLNGSENNPKIILFKILVNLEQPHKY